MPCHKKTLTAKQAESKCLTSLCAFWEAAQSIFTTTVKTILYNSAGDPHSGATQRLVVFFEECRI